MLRTTQPRRRTGVLVLAGVAATTMLALAGCSSDAGTADSTSSAKEINILTWSGYHEQEWLDEYEAETGVKVNVQLTGTVAEAFAKVQSDPGAFDLVLATAGWVENYVDADLIVPFDESKVANLSNTIQELDWRAGTTYNGENYGLTYAWGTQPLVYEPGTVSTAPTSWDVLWDPAYEGRVSMVDDPTTQLSTIALALGFDDPYDMSDAEFAEFTAKLQELRPQLTHVAASIQDQTTDFTSGQVDLGILYNINTYVETNAAGTPIELVIPEEGVAGWTDNYVITKAGAAKGDVVYDFIDETMSVEWMSRLMAEIGVSGNLSLEAAQSEEALAAGLDEEALMRTEAGIGIADPTFFEQVHMLRRLDNLDEWLALWNDFKLNFG